MISRPSVARKTFFLSLLFFGLYSLALSVGPPSTVAQDKHAVNVLYVELDGGISPIQVDLLELSIQEAAQRGFDMILLRLDTPGGLVESTRGIVKEMLNSPMPVLVWVGPSGARAASAGVFIVAASDVAAMSPQTTIGAASPVTMGGGDVNGTMERKVKNDILSLLRSLASRKDRNIEWYAKAVEEADSITASEAVMSGVVEMLAEDPEDFLQQAGARGVPTSEGVLRFSLDNVNLVPYEPGFRYDFLSWLLHPQIAYFLFLGGIAGLFFEVSHPGSIFPGVAGALCLLLALYALSVLPTNAAGILLILFSLVLLILEIFITSYGLLSIAALLSLFIGSTILYREGTGLVLPLSSILATVITLAVFVTAVLYLVSKAQLRKPTQGQEAIIGAPATVRTWSGTHGRVFLRGEVWNAVSPTPMQPSPGDTVRIVRVEGLTLTVEP
ncbi:nodulation protein NfeD [Oceanidesulfovibrio indonesiensis]|uniref:Nodulation protein NfeD n=1 Tax=Oceanidesulfovibrio indonesiensis TaxID=54767 RepID=A0A7M3MDG4_9BACT|nr:nodulation protein NfeD [Oceanidesulfovibrio indonesiensis]